MLFLLVPHWFFLHLLLATKSQFFRAIVSTATAMSVKQPFQSCKNKPMKTSGTAFYHPEHCACTQNWGLKFEFQNWNRNSDNHHYEVRNWELRPSERITFLCSIAHSLTWQYSEQSLRNRPWNIFFQDKILHQGQIRRLCPGAIWHPSKVCFQSKYFVQPW